MQRETSRSEISPPAPADTSDDGIWVFFAVACAITWALAAPAARAWLRHQAPPPYAIACAGLSAFGPLLAALAVAGPRRQLRAVFGRWRTSVGWIALALVGPAALHLLATALEVVTGGHPAQWLYPPMTPEQVAALVVFPLGEEFGWRGFAQPRLVRRYGPVRGSLVVGAVWGLWHLLYGVTPQSAGFDTLGFVLLLVELPLYSVIIGWIFERSGRSLAVALAFHAGAHLDNIQRAPRTDLRLQGLHILVLLLVAIIAARALRARDRSRTREA
jgi:membrane protease YdiL (CAAX protease family)